MEELFWSMDDFNIIEMYSRLLGELKRRNIIRTNNLVGDWGERLAIKYYNESLLLPNLQAVKVGAKGVDAINSNNERYNIKATRTRMTSVFNGLNDPDSELPQEKKFEYVIIVILNEDMSLKAMYELNWEGFLSLKKWNKSKRTWYLNVTKELERKAKILFN